MVTIGEKLAEARLEAGLSIEDVAHKTHIHPTTIQNIELDDLSMFPSVTYARSFISKYADFLSVDLSSAMQALNSGFTVRLGENELMDEMKQTIKKDRRFRLERRPKSVRRKLEKPGGAPLFLNFILVALIAALAVFYFLGFSASTPEEAKSEITRGLQKAIPFSEEGPVDAGTVAGTNGSIQTTIDDGLNLPENPLKEKPAAETPQRATLKQVDLSRTGETTPEPPSSPVVTPTTPHAVPPGPPMPLASSSSSDGIRKPNVNWGIDTAKPKPLAKPVTSPGNAVPAVRKTPRFKIEPDFTPPPIQSADLPAVRKVLDEPAAVLRPAGTDPTKREEPARRKPSDGSTATQGEVPVRATPVARTQ
ncbi:MAG: helix-turn-helix domain-containing protein [Verrucomicrobiales bacterium]|nr:helix-turn-helix domain-containing protein [Verrucomicrobiales bacterium]